MFFDSQVNILILMEFVTLLDEKLKAIIQLKNFENLVIKFKNINIANEQRTNDKNENVSVDRIKTMKCVCKFVKI